MYIFVSGKHIRKGRAYFSPKISSVRYTLIKYPKREERDDMSA